MTQPEPTGYRESPDTTDARGAEPETEGSPLTTDDDAQRDDLPVRPGNESD